ncbi:MAG: MBL fold metallo-hydrolase [Candidatus Nealsonbacteria bacterium]|nr:MBL fold metallo-hydrolase [Candidatus Nealsonbacteria bacterium]
MPKSSKKWVYIILGGLVCANVIAFSIVYDLSRPKLLKVDFFDVGQGDAAFIEAPNNNQILIDGGPTSAVISKLAKEMPFYDRTIDLVILTHPDYDHLSGLLDVLKRYKVKNILWTGVITDTPQFSEWQKLLSKENANMVIAKKGERVIIQSDPLVYLDVLYPDKDLEGNNVKNTNDTSVVSRLVFNNSSFLFTGDATEKVDPELSVENLKSDVLKVAHHGSKDSMTDEFLNSVLPQTAVISVGKDNSYGHPNIETLEKLNKSGIQVLRTDEMGDVRFVSDGKNIKVIE